MSTQEFVFTGYKPSGDPSLQFFDNRKNKVFASGNDILLWSKKPTLHDKITIMRSNVDNCILLAFINGEKVYEKAEKANLTDVDVSLSN